MKKLFCILICLSLSVCIFANTNTYTYFSVSHEAYRADYVGSTYNFSKNETSDFTKNCFSFKFGYKEQISEKLMGGISYGYSFVFFENALLVQFPLMLDFYYQYNCLYNSVSAGILITDNNNGTITAVPNIEIGLGLDIPLGQISVGLKTSVSSSIWPYRTNISDFNMITKIKPLEVMFMIKD